MGSDKMSSTGSGELDIDHKHVDSAAVYDVERLDDGVPRHKLGGLWHFVQRLDKYGVEVRGIERVPPTERHHTRITDAFTLWLAGTQAG
jgi:hypothetical protein